MAWVEDSYIGYTGAREPIFQCFNTANSIKDSTDLTDKSVLVLHGGGDISPSLYNKPLSAYVNGSVQPSMRDKEEWEIAQYAIKHGIPIIGICRGAQLLCALAGGYLVQHILEHSGANHLISGIDGTIVQSNSCHHQMMVPQKDAIILASCDSAVTGVDEEDNWTEYPSVPEIVYFPSINALGIQGHPEWMRNSKFNLYCSTLINKYLLKE